MTFLTFSLNLEHTFLPTVFIKPTDLLIHSFNIYHAEAFSRFTLWASNFLIINNKQVLHISEI